MVDVAPRYVNRSDLSVIYADLEVIYVDMSDHFFDFKKKKVILTIS